MILLQQLSELVGDVRDDMVNGKAGTGTTLYLKTQTALVTGVANTDVTLDDKTSTSSSISVTHTLTVSIGNGSTLTEFEVNDSGTVSYNRSVKAAFAKTTQLEYTIFHTFDFEVIT